MQYKEVQIFGSQASVIQSILSATAEISSELRRSPIVMLESMNKFGDQQLQQDIHCDNIVQKHLRMNPLVKGFASEERPQLHSCGEGEGYIVTYDPLDGSSIVDTNFSVGSIFSIWQNKDLVGQKLSNQVNAVLSIYGPRTTAILYNSKEDKVQELTWIEGSWIISYDHLQIKSTTNMFSPGNLRSVSQIQEYNNVILRWMKQGYIMSYCGGLVPDIALIFLKGHGIFINLASKSYKAKLRVLYEIASIAFLIQKSGGKTVTVGANSLLNYVIKLMMIKCTFLIQSRSFAAGSHQEIQKIKYLFQS